MDEKSLRTLEYDKVLKRLTHYTSFSAGEALATALRPTTDPDQARLWQLETQEAKALFESGADVMIGGTRDVRSAVERSERGFTLLTADFMDIKSTLIAARTLQRKLIRLEEEFPNLADIAYLIEECPGIVGAITKTIDEQGEVLDSASPALARIRRELRVAYNRLQDKLRALLTSSNNQYLQEPIITSRAGRYVVPLRAEHKGRIKGIIHDQSGSGATLWIEPLFTVELNNEYRTLQIQEQKEIDRILAALSAEIAVQGEPLTRVVERMAELDLIFARARFAMETDAVAPQFVPWRKIKQPSHKHNHKQETIAFNPHPGSTLWIRGARHPLLDPATVVATDFLLDEDTFIVLITGPNTGGKTVSLKNLGLMILMAQSGLHLPAIEARLTVFNDVFADIGDEQSIEQSLSTFSAHITNIIHILDQVDDHSFVVLDELGSGTDPAEGAALAQSITGYLRDKGATTFIATHYPELKLYASQTPGATNASLMFDIETLSPTYEMVIGIPGKSNALAIGRRLGLNETILNDAMLLLGVGSQRAESLLDTIHDLREKIESEEAATRLALRSAEKERDTLSTRLDELDIEAQRILNAARRQGQAELEEVRAEIRAARRQIRDASSLNALKKTSQQLTEVEAQQKQPVAIVTDKLEPAAADATRPPNRAIEQGDAVYVKSLQTTGEIISIQGKSAEVAIGRLHTRVKLTDLQLRAKVQESAEEIVVPIAAPRTVKIDLDLRGQRVEAGIEEVIRYLDAASLTNVPFVRIIHGKGTGSLRKAVRKVLTDSQYVTSWEEGKDGEGGAGVTVAHLRVS